MACLQRVIILVAVLRSTEVWGMSVAASPMAETEDAGCSSAVSISNLAVYAVDVLNA